MQDPLNTDLYEVLGVDPEADAKEISRAYKQLARDLHPDTHPDDAAAEDRFKEVTAAYEVLGDTDKRAEYDQFRSMVGQGGGGFDPNMGAGFADAEGIFSRLFGPQGVGGMGGSLGFRGADVRARVTLELGDVIGGASPSFKLPDGTSVKVAIPKGVEDGEVIRLPGRGMTGVRGGPPGDLVVEVSVVPHPRFTRTGNDLATTVVVDYPTAVLGGQAAVRTFEGQEVRIKIPAGSQVGRIFRLRGRGIATRNATGDLLAELTVEIPTEVTEEVREALESMRGTQQKAP